MKAGSYAIGIDIGGTKIAVALFRADDSGEMKFARAATTRRLKDVFGGETPGKKTIHLFEKALLEASRELQSGGSEHAVGVGVCSAGFVEDGIIVEGWNTGMFNYPLLKTVSDATGLPATLLKDSWAPVYALRPGKAAIIFSVGTGLGGVSCNADNTIPLKSRTENRRLKWIPYLYCNDDPGYAVSFSEALIADAMTNALEDMARDGKQYSAPMPNESTINGWAKRLMGEAAEKKRLSPSKLELFLAGLLAPKSVSRMRAGEIYADLLCSAELPAIMRSFITGEYVPPPEIDGLLLKGDAAASAAHYIHAWFLGCALHEMQRERVENMLSPATVIYGTGSGYNDTTHSAMKEPIVRAMNYFGNKGGFAYPETGPVQLLGGGSGETTFACLGAATAAMMEFGE